MNELLKNLYSLFDAAYEENMNGRGTDITRMVTTYIPTVIQDLQADDYNVATKFELSMSNEEKIKKILTAADEQCYLSGLDFSVLMHELLIPEGGWVIDTGNYENVNAEVARRLVKNIKNHPILWKYLFMVA